MTIRKSAMLAVVAGLTMGQLAWGLGQPSTLSPGLLDGQAGVAYSDLNATFEWAPLSGAEWYQVYCTQEGGTVAFRKWVQGATSCTIGNRTALRAGRTYHWWVQPWNKTEGYGTWSAARTFVAQNVKTLYLSAQTFRPLSSFALWQFEAGGGMINPQTADTEWIAPIALSDRVTITAIELRWKNRVFCYGASIAALRVFNEGSAASLDFLSTFSTEREAGIQSVSSAAGAFLPPIAGYHPSVYVHLTDVERWLMGVNVSYFE